MHVHYYQHESFEGPGSIGTWARERGHRLTCTRWFGGERPPPLDVVDLLVVLGGGMSVGDESIHPWLLNEKRCIASALSDGLPVLGICLGAQLIADVLGASVRRQGHREIGWFPVRMEPERPPLAAGFPSEMDTFHWHGDSFELPANCSRVGSSDATAEQGFVYGDRVLALQFHPEATTELVKGLIAFAGEDLGGVRYVQTPDQMLEEPMRFARMNEEFECVLDALAERSLARAPGPTAG